ncbi:MAG: hypothetical protein KC618_03110, partial [Candidatus Omnitrophica bacterium]|nr:hypothetical protein [Candidatus Omnitrophota bacterium]
MFQSIELFVDQKIDLDNLLNNLVALRYQKVHKSCQPGEFSHRGGILDIYPTDFEHPVRIDIDDDKIKAIASVNIKNGKSIWKHKIVIILPNKRSGKDVFSEDIPLTNFVDLNEGDFVVHNYHGIGRYLGVKEFDIDNKKLKHLMIEYEGGDR